MKKVVAIVQARMGSTRLPNKVMQPIQGIPMIELLLGRLRLAKSIGQIVLATSSQPRNAPLVGHVESLGFAVFQGSEEDVLNRYYQAAVLHQADIVVRITGDCPLIDPRLVDDVVIALLDTGAEYASNTLSPSYPDGLDVEAFTFPSLVRAWQEARSPFEREHVTPYLKDASRFQTVNLRNDENHAHLRWTVDESDDLKVVRNVFAFFAPRLDFSWIEVLKLWRTQPQLFEANAGIPRDEGSQLGTGQKLWKRAKRVIPGGNMLLSKRAEMFLPDQWPAYFSRSKGCRVWDMDGHELIDMSFMGIGTNILGYAHPEVDEAVRRVVGTGNMTTLNCPEEVYLAERLVELHPWADMVRLTRTGGEANAVAIRIARATTGKEKIAFCGYHGWHDWYLAANLNDNGNLSGHLLPGLAPKGVPQCLQGTMLPFRYNHFEELQALVDQHPELGVIIMEVQRNELPMDGFLEKVRMLASLKGIVLIFDECSSGFRETFGGLQKKYGVEPDMAMFGKALGNGYAINAVIGRREIMESAQDTFISSTFWTERIGPSAALASLDVMERLSSWEIITNKGLRIKQGWQDIASRNELNINIFGLPAMPGFCFDSENNLTFKTLITQEMLKKGFLAGTSIYLCIDHSDRIIDAYFNELDAVFRLIRSFEQGHDVTKLLEGPVCHSGFKRLN